MEARMNEEVVAGGLDNKSKAFARTQTADAALGAVFVLDSDGEGDDRSIVIAEEDKENDASRVHARGDPVSSATAHDEAVRHAGQPNGTNRRSMEAGEIDAGRSQACTPLRRTATGSQLQTQDEDDEDDGLFEMIATPPARISTVPQRVSSPASSASVSGPDAGFDTGSRATRREPTIATKCHGQRDANKSSPVQPRSTGPSAAGSSSKGSLDDQGVEELNAMLLANLQRKDRVNEQLIRLMEGTASPGTDPEFVQSSRQFLTARIEQIKEVLARRGSLSFPGASQTSSNPAGTSRLAKERVVPPPQPHTLASRSSPIVLSSPVLSPEREVKYSASLVPYGAEAGPSRANQTTPPPRNRSLTTQDPHGASSSVSPPAVEQRSCPRSSSMGKGKQKARSVEEVAEDALIAEAMQEDFFDEDEEALMAEIHGSSRHVNGGQGVLVPPRATETSAMRQAQVARPSTNRFEPSDSANGGPSVASCTSPVSFRGTLRHHNPQEAASGGPVDASGRSTGKGRSDAHAQMNYVWSRDVAKALRRTFKLQDFRSNQLEAINATLNGDDVFCLMPTGGGKSLCYQLPALIDSGRTQGVTVVVSPLISLIHDQVSHLLDLTIPALMLTGDMQGPKREFALGELFSKSPTTRLLYLTPEFVGRSRQASDIFTSLYRKKLLARFVIDEAHCVSQWGHDFRPDYQTLGKLRQEYPDIPVMAMTATANHRVKADVVSSLGIKGCKVLEQSFNRANLRYEVREKNQRSVVADIAKFIQASHKNQCGIVYCLSRRACEDVAERLTREHRLQAQHYHAALTKSDRTKIQEAWQKGEFRIIVATIAFGMGIDKGDVRFVVHHTLPQSLEGYYQETGRAGRDGKSSTCVLYFNYKDTNVIKRMIDDGEGTKEQKDQQHSNLRRVVQFCMNKSDCRRAQVLQYFGEVFPAEACHHTCDNCCNAAKNHQQAELQDLTSQAKQAVELVGDLMSRQPKGGFTMLHFVDVFRGSQSRAVRDRGHHNHKWAGAGSTMNRGDVERLFQHLTIREVFNERSEVNAMGFANAYLELGPEAQSLLEGKLKVELSVQRATAPVTQTAIGGSKKRTVTAVRGSRGEHDSDFESPEAADHWDISNMNLSPSPEPANQHLQRGAANGAGGPLGRRSVLARVDSFEGLQLQRGSSSRTPRGGLTTSNATTAAITILDDEPYAGVSTATSHANDIEASDALYQSLVTLRNQVVQREQCDRASDVFDNATLRRMAEASPKSIAEFVRILGVDDDKYERFGSEFLACCKRSAASATTATSAATASAATPTMTAAARKRTAPGSSTNATARLQPEAWTYTSPEKGSSTAQQMPPHRKKVRASDGGSTTSLVRSNSLNMASTASNGHRAASFGGGAGAGIPAMPPPGAANRLRIGGSSSGSNTDRGRLRRMPI